MARFPLTSRAALAFHITVALASNGVVAWLVSTGRVAPLELVALVALEAALLLLIAWLQSRRVPPSAREAPVGSARDRLATWVFALIWLGGVYGVVLGLWVPPDAALPQRLRDPAAYLADSPLVWPLLITLHGAAVDVVGDHRHFRRVGGSFISTPGLNGAARWMTLFLGGIPFLVPLVAVLMALQRLVEQIRRRLAGQGQTRNGGAALFVVVTPLLLLAVAGTTGWLVRSEVSGWAVGYASAKFVAELFVVCMPLIAATAYAEESQAAGRPPRRSRLP